MYTGYITFWKESSKDSQNFGKLLHFSFAANAEVPVFIGSNGVRKIFAVTGANESFALRERGKVVNGGGGKNPS